MKWTVLSLFLSLNLAHAAHVTIIDSGTDYKHADLASKFWENPVDSTENGQDEDGNGYIDDVRGWNIAEKNNQIIDYKYLGTFL